MRSLQSVVLIFLSLILISSCQTIKDVKLINNTEVEPTRMTLRGKSILLTPIVHFGQKEFFRKLTDSIAVWKGSGYTVYYEEMNIGPHEKDVTLEEYTLIFKKFRKMTSGGATREGYSELKETFPDGMTQPEYSVLGLDSLDFNADVTIKEFVDEYERLYGPVTLSSCDLETHLDSLFTCDEPLKNDMDPVIDDFRNKMLVKQLVAAKEKKIVVLYGAHHIKPLEKALKRYQ